MEEVICDRINCGEVMAIIPARSGSKGVKDKNIKCVSGYPLMAYSIAAAKLCSSISRVIVSTDSRQYAKIAQYYGADVPFLRPLDIAGDNATDITFMRHAIQWLYDNEGKVPEYIVHLRPTTPVRDPRIIESAIQILKSDVEATSLRSSHRTNETPYKWFTMENGYYRPLMPDMTVDEVNNPRQSFNDIYIPNGYIDVLKVSFIVKNDLLHGNKSIGFIVSEGIDIDFSSDFEKVEASIKGHILLTYLEKNFEKKRM